MKQKLNLYKLMFDRAKKKQKYFKNYIRYAKIISQRAKRILNDAEVIIFGSIVKGNYSIESDIDILIISKKIPESLFEQTKFKDKLLKRFNANPFELHLATPEIYENWFKNFIKEDYIKL